MQKGCTINYSFIRNNDGKYEYGMHYTDTNGIDIDLENSSDNLSEMVDDMAKDFLQEYMIQEAALEKEEEEELLFDEEEEEKDEYTLQLEKIIKDLTAENNSLKTDLDILQRRADKQKKDEKSYNSYYEDYDNYIKDLIDYVKHFKY